MLNKLKKTIYTILAIIAVLTISLISATSYYVGISGIQKIGATNVKYFTTDSQYLDNTPIIAAYAAVIHRVWIDKPSYVEDVLWETDEMLHLDTLLAGNWEDTFEFWSTTDSIDYNTNWYYDPIQIDDTIDRLPKQPKPDKLSNILQHIELTNGD